MSILEILILAVVQGVTEFLPVSSSGHLVVAEALLAELGRSLPADLLEVNIVLHLGTLFSILLFYCREVWKLVSSDRRLIPLLIVGTMPAAVIGIPLKELGQEWLESPLLAGMMFPVTAALLVWAARMPSGTTHYRDLTLGGVVKIGSLQAVALLPGISRSGSTIAGGLACGLDRASAGTFAFLLAIPAIAGAGLIEVLKLWREVSSGEGTPSTAPPVLCVGFVVAMVVGYVALAWLCRFIQAGKLGQFAWYLVPLGLVVTLWQLGLVSAAP